MARQMSFRKRQVKGRAEDIDELTRLRRGASLHLAEDTGEQPGSILPIGRPFLSQDLSGRNQARQFVAPDMVQYEPLPEEELLPDYPTFDQYGQVLGSSSSPMTLNDFFTQLDQAQHPSLVGQSDQLEQIYQQTGTAYPVQSLENGMARYNDGSIRPMPTEPLPIASMRDGSVLFSDGTIKGGYTGGRQQFSGVEGLSQAVFGQNQTVTQPFGNINPIEPTPGNVNLGTDFRTRDLQNRNLKLPFDVEVVGVTQDDGTRFGDLSGHQGYGNSILVRLPSGEMLRFAHLSQMADVQPGTILNAGQVFGVPGTTGNTYGEHLDLEYYNAQGQIDDPRNFDVRALVSAQSAPAMSQANQLEATKPQYQPQPTRSEPAQQPQQRQPEYQPWAAPIADRAVQAVAEPVKQTGQALGAAIDQNKPLNKVTGGLGVGASEVLQGNIPRAKQELGRTIDTAGRGVANVIDKTNPTRDFDTGISEFLRGDMRGAQRNFADAKQRVLARLGAMPSQASKEIVKPAYAADGNEEAQQQSLSQNLGDIANRVKSETAQQIGRVSGFVSDTFGKAGEGIRKLQGAMQFGQNANMSMRPDASEITDRRAIGDTAGMSEATANMSMAQAQNQSKSDIRDPFFKTGQAQQFGSFLKPGAEKGVAISMDMFGDNFFTDPNRVKSVFGNTHLAEPAQAKYQEWRKAEDERIRLEEERRRAREPRPTLEDYLRRGKTAAQFFAETGQQSSLDAAGGDANRLIEAMRAPSVGEVRDEGQRSGSGSQSVRYDNGRVVNAPQGTNLRSDAGGNVQAVRDTSFSLQMPGGRNVVSNFDAPVSRPSAQLSGSNSFSFNRLKDMVTKLFRR